MDGGPAGWQGGRMGIKSKWRAGHMKDPVSGVFRVADWYDAHPHSSPPGTRLTGVVVADGVPPTPAETPADHKGKWVGQNELPITVDRADPTNFRVEWDQVVKNDWQSTARHRANEAAARLAGGDQPQGTSATTGGLFGTSAPGGGFSVAATGGDLSSMMEQALRSAGVDPGILNSPNRTVHVETSFGTASPDQARSMMAGFFGGQGMPMADATPSTQAVGVVRAVHDVVSPAPLPEGMSQADLTLDVERPDGSTYPVTTRMGFRTPARRTALTAIGTRLPVLVNQNDPGRVTIDVTRLNLS
jgi:hypothetical protein